MSLRNNLSRALLVPVMMWMMAPALAQQVLVRSYANPGQPIGQGYLSHYRSDCLALLPTHVAEEASTPAFLREGNGLLGESDDVADLGDDLSVARVTGQVTEDCGYSLSTISRAVDVTIRGQGIATLRSVNGDATLGRMAVAIIDDDGTVYLRVRPTNDRIQIRRGHSGSLLMIGDKPVGMLLSVKKGVGKVLRFDRMLASAEAHLTTRRGRNAAQAPSGSAQGDLAAAVNGGRVTGWNAIPVDESHRAANLIADANAGPWRARAEHWPVEVELDLAGDKVVISRIELDGSGIENASELPQRVEIFVNVNSNQRRWRSLISREVEFDANNLAVFVFAPTYARQVKIAIGNNNAASNVMSLRRIHIGKP